MGRAKHSKKTEPPTKSKLKKDPGVPRLPDLKARVRNAHKPKPMVPPGQLLDHDAVMASEPTLSTLALQADASSSSYAFQQNAATDGISSPDGAAPSLGRTKEQIRKYYLKALHKVVDESDIVILVLDARDPEGCRSRLVEEEVRRREAEGKKLVFVLNKIDLVPKANAQAWLKYLRHSTPTLPFLSSAASQHQRTNISSSTAPALLKLLKAYKPKAGSITVGVVGYPNVGKSSLINSLKRSKVCPVAAQPGFTKELQSIQLERGMRILDSPGVVFDEDDYDNGKGAAYKKGSVLLRNVVKVEDVEDPIAVVEEILNRTPPETVQRIYDLPVFTSTLEFLTMLSLKSGKLLKGGTPDINSAARQVLTDWNQQKIPYFSDPPAIHPSLIPSTVPQTQTTEDKTMMIAPGAENVGNAQILSEFSKAFTLEGLFGAADAGAFAPRRGEGEGADAPMGVVDDDGDVFWDAIEGDDMQAQDSDIALPQKRGRSPSEASSFTPPNQQDQEATMLTRQDELHASRSRYTRPPKRARKSKDVPDYDEAPEKHILAGMEKSNPLGRKALKAKAKKARHAGRVRGDASGNGVGMEIDGEGLGFTFMA